MVRTKILIACHKPSDCIENEIITPLQVRGSLPKEKMQDMLNDSAQRKVKFRPMDWRGIRILRVISRAPKYPQNEYRQACAEAEIVRRPSLSVRMRNKTKAAIKAVLMPPVNLIFPKYTRRVASGPMRSGSSACSGSCFIEIRSTLLKKYNTGCTLSYLPC